MFWRCFLNPDEPPPAKAWLWRIFRDLSMDSPKSRVWTTKQWKVITMHREKTLNFGDVPSNVRKAVHSLRSVENIEAVFNKKDGIGFCEKRLDKLKEFHEEYIYMDILPSWKQEKWMGNLFYVPSKNQIGRKQLVLAEYKKVTIVALATPRSLVFIEKRKQCNLFIDRNTGKIFGSHVPSNQLRGRFREKVNMRIIELVKSKPSTQRSEKRSGTGAMKSFGGYKPNPRFGNRSRVSFFAYKQSLKKLLAAHEEKANDFQTFLNRFAHLDVLELILGCFMFNNPRIAHDFLLANSCYLDDRDYKANQFDIECRKRVAGIQMFISKDYASRIHTDVDHSSHTIGYVCSSEAGRCATFFYASHGLALPLENGDLFSFMGALPHGTIQERSRSGVTYVTCLTTNKSFGKQIGL